MSHITIPAISPAALYHWPVLLVATALALCSELSLVQGWDWDERGCLATSQGQDELRQLLQREVRHGNMIFPIDDNGKVDGHLFDLKPEALAKFVSHPQYRHHSRRRHHRHRGRYGRSTSQCAANKVCTAVYSLQEDADRIPRTLLVATCPNCSRCANLGGSCTQTMYTMSVFRNCTTTSDSECASCTTVQESVPVGCSCILDTLNKKR